MRILSKYFRMLVICCLSSIVMKSVIMMINSIRNPEYTYEHTVLFYDSHTVPTIGQYKQADTKLRGVLNAVNQETEETSDNITVKTIARISNHSTDTWTSKTELEMNVKRYFAKESRIIRNPYNHPLSTNGSKICDGNHPPFLIIMCLSLPRNVNTRQTIRNTWASPIQSKQWPTDKHLRISRVKLVFVFGETNSSQDDKIIKRESELFGDVVKADFVDTYRNLTRKVIVGMHWAVNFCQGFKYLMKTDEDTFVNIRNALLYLQSLIVNEKGVIIGALNNSSRVARTGKWKITSLEYPYEHYPDYISGQTYVVSGNLVPKLIHEARYLPYFYLEDVFITGIVRVIAGADFINENKRFPHQLDKIPRICQFFRSTRISATNVNNRHKIAIWNQLLNSHRHC